MSDTQCFHCGAAVPGRQVVGAPVEEDGPSWQAGLRLGLLVLALMVLGLILTNWMGKGLRRATDVVEGASGPAGWQAFVPPDQTYQIWLPADWQVATPQDRGWQERVEGLPQPLPVSFSQIAPAQPVDRVSLVALSKTAQDRQPVTLSVQLHPGLAQASLISLQVDDWSDGEIPLDTRDKTELSVRKDGGAALVADLTYPREGGSDAAHAWVMLMRSADGLYAVTAWADAADFERHEETIRLILSHFQLSDFLQGQDTQ